MTTINGMPSIAINASALEKNEPVWLRNALNWHRLDRMQMTEEQAVSLVEKTMETDYFSSGTLLKPSIEEFTVIVRIPNTSANTYIAYRPALLTAEDICDDEINGIKRITYPAIDAYVYVNNEGTQCNFVLTLALCILENEGRKLRTTTQFISWEHDDPFTRFMIQDDEEKFSEFTRTVKGIFMAVQMMSMERPEIMVRETVREERQETVQHKGRYKKIRKTSMVRVIRVSDHDLETFVPRGHHNMTCPSWSVAGHMRRYKSGNEVWVKPYRKGKERNNPAAFQPKEYQIPKEV